MPPTAPGLPEEEEAAGAGVVCGSSSLQPQAAAVASTKAHLLMARQDPPTPAPAVSRTDSFSTLARAELRSQPQFLLTEFVHHIQAPLGDGAVDPRRGGLLVQITEVDGLSEHEDDRFPGAEEVNRRGISLPYFTKDVPELVEQYIQTFEKVWAHRKELA